MMPDDNRKALEERVDQFNPTVTARVAALAESLGQYGFEGKISVTLSVSVKNKINGSQDALVERKMDLSFKR